MSIINFFPSLVIALVGGGLIGFNNKSGEFPSYTVALATGIGVMLFVPPRPPDFILGPYELAIVEVAAFLLLLLLGTWFGKLLRTD